MRLFSGPGHPASSRGEQRPSSACAAVNGFPGRTPGRSAAPADAVSPPAAAAATAADAAAPASAVPTAAPPQLRAPAGGQTSPLIGRRAAVALLAAGPFAAASTPGLARAAAAAAADVPPPSQEVGEVGGTLNDCGIDAVSCASSMSDDVRFFYNPWEYDGPRDAAVQQLIEVATGGAYDPGLRRDDLNGSLGIAKSDAAAFIVGTTLTTIAGRPPPEKPRPRVRADFRAFDGVLVDKHTTEDGSVYVWVTFGLPSDDSSSSSSSDDEEDSPDGSGVVQRAAVQKQQPQAAEAERQGQQQQAAAKQQGSEQQQQQSKGQEEPDSDGEGGSSGSSSSSSSDEEGDEAAAGTNSRSTARKGNKGGGSKGQVDPAAIVDAEFIFPKGDNIVNVRAASRAEPGFGGGRLALSFEQGVVFDRNEARRQLEALRKALRWEPIVVLSNDDPRYNSDRPLFFERLFDPFVKTGRQPLQE